MKSLTCSAFALLLAGSSLSWWEDEAKTEKPAEGKKAIYNEKADAKVAIESALAEARRENRRVLIQWGGNWCSWCLLLHDCFKNDPKLAKILRDEYAVVLIDSNNNGDLARQYRAIGNHGVPFLTVLDSTGKVLANQPTDPFETNKAGKKGHDPAKLLEFLTTHQAPPLKADEVLEKALAEAAKSERNVFLHFGASWCGWCVRLDAWLASPAVAKVVGKDFLDVKIDMDRMKGAKEVLNRFRPSDKGGIPWFVMLDAKGKAIVTSDGSKGNIGFPATADEIAHFVKMLEKAKRRITDQEVEQLRKSLEEAEEQRKKETPPRKP